MPTLSADHLVKSYKGRTVVNGFTFSLSSGEVVGLLGPNGAGKTTSFYMIVGLVLADQGHVFLDEQDITEMPMHGRARLGLSYLAQEPSIFRKLTVNQNIVAILETRKDIKKKNCDEECERLLYDLGISHLGESLAMTLSGGERRRLEIARALAVNPHFVLLDEPFAGVDPISVVDIQRIIKGLSSRNIGVLISDHNVRETLGICDRAYVINEGAILAEGSPEHILENREVRSIYLGEDFRM